MQIMIFLLLLMPANLALAGAEDLVKQLGDADPNIRGQAYESLKEMKDAARDALTKGAQSAQPQIAESCQTLLSQLPWYQSDDPPEAIAQLTNYGTSTDAQRAQILCNLFQIEDPHVYEVALRIVDKEASDEVIWGAYSYMPKTDAWQKLLLSRDINTLKPQLLYSLAWSYRATDPSRWMELMLEFLWREQSHPTAPAERIFPILELQCMRYCKPDQMGKVVESYRNLVRLDSLQIDGDYLTQRLLSLHARYGPFPGFMGDMQRFGSQSPYTDLALAHLADRVGAIVPAAIFRVKMIDSIEHDLIDPELVSRMLIMLGEDDRIDMGYFQQAAKKSDIDEQVDSVVTANLMLYELYRGRSDDLHAGQRLEQAASYYKDQPGKLLALPNAIRVEELPVSRVMLKANAYYLQHAYKSGNLEKAKSIAEEMCRADDDDDMIFIENIDELKAVLPAADFKAYAERVYKQLKVKLETNREDVETCNQFAWLCARANIHVEEALKPSELTIERQGEYAAYLDTLAEIHFRLGNPKKSVELETKALNTVGEVDAEFFLKQIRRFRSAATQPTYDKSN